MKRDLVFVRGGTLGESLGVTPERAALFDNLVGKMIEEGKSLRECVETLNERGDMTDAEWTAFCYTIGWYQGRRSR